MQKLTQSPTDAAFVQDPYPFYDRARAAGPLFHWTDYDMACAVGHAEVSAILRERRMGREAPAERATDVPDHLAAFYACEAHSMLELEPPAHTRLRKLVLHAFTSRRINALAPEIEALCHRLIDGFPQGEFDLLDAYARQVPVIIIARLMGLPESRADDLLAWSNAMVGMYQAGRTRAMEDAAELATQAFCDFLAVYVAEKRRTPGDDLISELIVAEQQGEKLTTEELISTCILLLNAGHEATVHSLGNAVKTLLEHDHREIDAPCVEELLRLDPPLHMFTRWVYEDLEIFGQRFERGDRIACLLGAANRDPEAYPEPHRFDPARKGPAHMGFGAGIHFCVGAPLARLEMRVALSQLMRHCPELRLAEEPRYADLYHFHGLERLMVRAF
ncbi:cytochrome P450 [Limimaricola cinnabarinus]|jgi:cytochrome P450|uniref:Cytochrome P450 n=1 Tax=Limimaricola cinnabarinus TaxID=1125964 RepID=A0A2G1MFC4_9RHOB|nr:cytochrome P450 [Limimaricola cinnabarinus]PHP27372.1 cytochrome P450 [Limimaricola cinnabarinus]